MKSSPNISVKLPLCLPVVSYSVEANTCIEIFDCLCSNISSKLEWTCR